MGKKQYLVLKHDVETDVARAYRMAVIEQKYGHRGSYYVQAYLLEKPDNIRLLREMQQMGHEISYHYDVLDACRGDMEKAMEQFARNRQLFADHGFPLRTVCQHGNPVAERIGYTSNRDFFRHPAVRRQYPEITDIMVDFPEKVSAEYLYFSDAGRVFRYIWDPIGNDVVPSDDKNISYSNLDEVLNALSDTVGNIISTHPHRWTKSAAVYAGKAALFRLVRGCAKVLVRIPAVKKLAGKYYFLAKKL